MEKSFSERVAEAMSVVSPLKPHVAAALSGGCEEVVFIDPRPADVIAVTTGLIPGARNVTLSDIASGKLPRELGNKSTRVITSCLGGPMAAVAAHELVKLGFTRVNYVEGGTQGWLDAGLPTVRPGSAPAVAV